jgi:hypothetical protein
VDADPWCPPALRLPGGVCVGVLGAGQFGPLQGFEDFAQGFVWSPKPEAPHQKYAGMVPCTESSRHEVAYFNNPSGAACVSNWVVRVSETKEEM